MGKADSFWQMVASRWQKLGTPLRPSEEDQKIVTKAVYSWIFREWQSTNLTAWSNTGTGRNRTSGRL